MAEVIPALAEPLLAVEGLEVEFRTSTGTVHAVNGVSFSLGQGEVLCLVGESGSGKSITGETIMGILDSPPGFVTGGSVRFRGEDLLTLDETRMNAVRGSGIAMVFQDALASLNPVLPVGEQIAEMFSSHRRMGRAEARDAAIAVMERVQIPGARQRYGAYPHEFSGGMRQRIMIAIAVALRPAILIADEPTTALDVTVQAGIVSLMADLCAEEHMGLILITHDLSIVANVADRVAVMYAGRIVETAPVIPLFDLPLHPYTRGLMNSVARVEGRDSELNPIPGSPPDPRHIPAGCPFHPRCAFARERCVADRPLLRAIMPGRLSACHFAEEIAGVQ